MMSSSGGSGNSSSNANNDASSSALHSKAFSNLLSSSNAIGGNSLIPNNTANSNNNTNTGGVGVGGISNNSNGNNFMGPGLGSLGSLSSGGGGANTNANLFGLSNLGGGGVNVNVNGGGGNPVSAPGVGIGVGLPSSSSSSISMGMGGGVGAPANGPAGAPSAGGSSGVGGVEELLPLVIHLTNPEEREGVLLELSKKRESFPDLAPILWHTYGTVAALLQEIVSIYPLLSPPTLTAHASNRVCNALALLQCVASHPDTRSLFLSAHVPLYLYPFLNTQSKSRPFEYLRLTSLGVVGALVKMDDPDVINFLLQTEIIPLCLRIMETGSELSKTVATFIVQKILLDEIGLSYVCATAERFYAVSTVLNNMIGILVLSPSVRLLKHIVRCYLRLSDNVRAREALRQCLPISLRDETFGNALRDDVTVKKWLSQLLSAVGPPANNPAGAGGVMDGATGGSGGLSVGGAGGNNGLGGGSLDLTSN